MKLYAEQLIKKDENYQSMLKDWTDKDFILDDILQFQNIDEWFVNFNENLSFLQSLCEETGKYDKASKDDVIDTFLDMIELKFIGKENINISVVNCPNAKKVVISFKNLENAFDEYKKYLDKDMEL